MSDYTSRPDATLAKPGLHDGIVGEHFRSYDGFVYLCESHDQQGYWLYNTNGANDWRGISERAIGRTFMQVHRDGGRYFTSWGPTELDFHLDPVPALVPISS